MVDCPLHKNKVFNYAVVGYRFHAHSTPINFILQLNLLFNYSIKKVTNEINSFIFRSIQRHAEEIKKIDGMKWTNGAATTTPSLPSIN